MNQQRLFKFIIFIFWFAVFINPQSGTLAQGGCFDASGAPCTPTATKEDEIENNRRTPTPIPPTLTLTPTSTFTSTPSQTPSATFTSTNTSTATPTFTPTFTSTPSITPSPTPVPFAQVVLPGVGIGALILFFIVGLLFPIIQKIRVARRGY